MKKFLITALFTTALLTSAFSEHMNIPRRYVELGVKAEAGFSNNYFGLKDIFTKNINLNFPEISDNMSSSGFLLNVNALADVFLDINLKNQWSQRFRFASGIETTMSANIFKELFDFLAKGNKLNETQEFGSKINGDAFMYFNTTYGMEIKGFKFEITPAVFIPIVHAQSKKVSASFTNASTGNNSFDIEVQSDIYTCFDSSKFEDGVDTEDWATLNGSSAGFDIEFSLEHQIVQKLQGQAFIRTPIVPGSLNNHAEVGMKYSYSGSNILSVITGKADESPEYTHSSKYDTDNYYINRPFHTGIRAAWRPFGNWCSFNGMLGFGIRNPFSADAEGYMEYTLQADILLIHIFGFTYTSSYQNEVFTHSLGIAFNFKVLELDCGIGFQGEDYFRSFAGTGVTACVGVKMGW